LTTDKDKTKTKEAKKAKPEEEKQKEEPFVGTLNSIEQPKPEYSSFVRNNTDYLRRMNERITNLNAGMQVYTPSALATASSAIGRTSLNTEQNSKDLKAINDKEVIAILGPDASDAFKPSHDYYDMVRYHETWREDGIASAIVDVLLSFYTGDHFKTIIDVNEELDDTEEDDEQGGSSEMKDALDRFTNDERIKRYKRIIDLKNKELKVHKNLKAIISQMLVFGRAAWLNEQDPKTRLPIAIKILPSMSLGRLFHHRKKWTLLGLEYLDFKFPQSILKAEEIFYVTNKGHWHVTPGSLDYGYSLFEKIAPISELNRIINQRNLKEINFRMWAQMFVIKVLQDTGVIDKTQLQKLQKQMLEGAGNVIITSQQATVDQLKFDHDGNSIVAQRDANNKEMIRQSQAPEILFDPNTFNRATSDKIMQAWEASILRSQTTDLKDTIQEQWINRLLAVLLDNDFPATETVDVTADRLKEDQISVENWSANIPRDDEGKIEVWRLPWKIKVEFEKPNLEAFADKVEAAVKLVNSNIISKIKALKILEFDDEIEQAKLEQEKQEELQEQQLEAQLQEAQSPQPQPKPEEATAANTQIANTRQRKQMLNDQRQERLLNAAIKAFENLS